MNKEDFTQYFKQAAAPLASLIAQAPADKPDWTPPGGKFMPLGALLHHTAMCPLMVGVIAADQLPDAAAVQKLIAQNDNHRATPQEAQKMLQNNVEQTLKNLAALSEEDYRNQDVDSFLGNMKKWRLLLTGVDHLTCHKMQLLMYLKMLGRPVGWMNLVRG